MLGSAAPKPFHGHITNNGHRCDPLKLRSSLICRSQRRALKPARQGGPGTLPVYIADPAASPLQDDGTRS